MKKFLDISVEAIPLLMVFMAVLTLLTMLVVLYHKRQHFYRTHKKD